MQADYRSNSFEALLEHGRFSEAIQLRLETIAQTAHETRKELEASKFINGGAIVAGAVLGFGNPLMLLLGCGVGGALYAATVFKDWERSRKLCLLPMTRSSLFGIAGDIAAQRLRTHNPLEEVIDYVSPSQGAEYLTLRVLTGDLCRYLSCWQPHERIAAYNYAIAQAEFMYAMTGTPSLPDIKEAKQSIAVPMPAQANTLAAAKSPQMAMPIDRASALDFDREAAQLEKAQQHGFDLQLQALDAKQSDPWQADDIETEAIEVAAVPPAPTASISTDEGLFDWSRIADPDECPKLAVIGKMNAGKSRLIKYLMRHVLFPGQTVDAVSFDVFGRAWEWDGFKVIQDYQAMISQMADDLKTIKQRKRLYQEGVDDFTPMFRLLEESKVHHS
jgi:hypothetical protein